MDKRAFLLVLCLLCWLPSARALPSPPAVMAAPACPVDMESLAAATRILDVPRGSLTAEQVAQLPGSRFQPVQPGRLLSHGTKDWWLRVSLHNDTAKACRRLFQVGPARLRDVRVYLLVGTRWQVMRAGTHYPLDEWARPERQALFPVTVPAHAARVVLARIVSRGEMVSVVPRLWRPGYFRDTQRQHDFSRGLLYGGIWLLVLVSLALAWAYRRAPLALMALSVVFFTAYLATQANYAFVYLWPGLPGLNLWARIFLSAAFYAAFYAYVFTIGRVRRLGAWWSRTFAVVWVVFVLIALFGGLLGRPAGVMSVALTLDQLCRWGLAVAMVVGLWRKTLRSWYPLVLLGLLCAQSVRIYGHLLGLPISPPGGTGMYVPTVLVAGAFLLGSLANQVRKGHREHRRTQAALDRQRATEKQRLEHTVTLRTGELVRTLEARDRLLGYISHDLRAPLTGILGSVDRWRQGDTRRDYAAMIVDYVRQEVDMINELLDDTCSDLANQEATPEPGYLHAFLADLAAQGELLAVRHGSHFELDLAAGLPACVHADFHHLRRVLLNLLGNAAKFTDHGSMVLRVQPQVVSSVDRVGLHFIVDDDGPGMAPADRERLVLPYTRGELAKNHEGSGLGLAIVCRLLEGMNSQLLIDDVAGGGGRFHFVLALEAATEADMEPLTSAGESLDVDGDGRVVLVIDNDRQLRQLVSDLLDGYGFDTVTAADVAGAIDILHDRRVDVVMTDQYMDSASGWDVLRHVRERHASLPVLLYSAMPVQRPLGMAVTLDFDAVLLKPASGSSLVRLISTVLRSADPVAVGDLVP